MESFEIISTYTDAQAVDDGLLVAINRQDRVTRNVWEYLEEKTPLGAQPPDRWPVDMMGWFRATKVSDKEAQQLIIKHGVGAQSEFDKIVKARKALALARGLVSQNSARAKRVYEQNTDGGIFKLYPLIGADGAFTRLEEATLTSGDGKPINGVFWLLPNENGGITLMFPEDY